MGKILLDCAEKVDGYKCTHWLILITVVSQKRQLKNHYLWSSLQLSQNIQEFLLAFLFKIRWQRSSHLQ